MAKELLSTQELCIWHAFKIVGHDVMCRVERDISDATGLSGPDFGVLSRLSDLGKGQMRQQALAANMGWDKSRLSHQLTRMQERALVVRKNAEMRVVLVAITEEGQDKLDAARPIHAESIRRNLLSKLTAEQATTIVRIKDILGGER